MQTKPSPAATTSEAKQKAAKSGHPSGDKRFKRLDVAMKRSHYQADALIEVLHAAQEVFGFLELDVLTYVAHGLKLPLSRVYGVATFYHLFSLKPGGKHNCIVCLGTACYVKGAGQIIEELEQKLGIKVGETTADELVSLLSARCIGACGIAPAVVFDGEVAGKQDTAAVLEHLERWKS
jgi:bidirectional [NiFe] hydrogenase diaphorase subunit